MTINEQLGQDMHYVVKYFGKSISHDPNAHRLSRIWTDLDQWILDLLMGY